MIPFGSLVICMGPRLRRHTRRLVPDDNWNSTDGLLQAEAVHRASYGDIVHTNLGVPIRLLRPELPDLLMGIKRQTQIIYPKDMAIICMKLGAGPGRKIIEAGCGSGSLTVALSWFCGPTGEVASHEARPEFARLARRNLEWAGLGENVVIHERDIRDGFAVDDADALFLDVREPWLYLGHIPAAIKAGAPVGFLVPTVGQISALLAGLESGPFGEIEVIELFQRSWKPLPDRLRPNDRMTAHTGFLIFCRQQPQSPEFDNFLPKGTRERKQAAAKENGRSGPPEELDS